MYIYKHLVYSVPSTVPDSKTGPLIKRSIIQSTYMTVVVLCLLCTGRCKCSQEANTYIHRGRHWTVRPRSYRLSLDQIVYCKTTMKGTKVHNPRAILSLLKLILFLVHEFTQIVTKL